MKRIFIALTLLAGVVSCSSQVGFSVKGSGPVDGHSVYLVNALTGETLDSATVAGGAFAISGKAEKDALLYVSEEGSGWMTMFFNDGSPIEVGLADTTLSGSPLNEKLLSCDKALTGKYSDLVALSMAARTAETPEEREAVGKKMEEGYEAYVDLLKTAQVAHHTARQAAVVQVNEPHGHTLHAAVLDEVHQEPAAQQRHDDHEQEIHGSPHELDAPALERPPYVLHYHRLADYLNYLSFASC